MLDFLDRGRPGYLCGRIQKEGLSNEGRAIKIGITVHSKSVIRSRGRLSCCFQTQDNFHAFVDWYVVVYESF